MPLNATKILERVVDSGASDLHLTVGTNPVLRIKTKLHVLEDIPPLTLEDVEYFLTQILEDQQKEIFEVNKELDFSVALGNKSRFRVNAFFQRGYPSLALRQIPLEIPTFKDLHLSDLFVELCTLRQGLFLVTGPTGQGKSTTIATMLDYINEVSAEHIITIEDPIEYVFTNKLSVIEQREMYIDTHSWAAALKGVLRQDPNIIFIGEMRDLETIESALTLAETGHLVMATLHTNSASQTVERIVTSFPEDKQNQIKHQLAHVLEVVISQRLIANNNAVYPAFELMLANDAIRNMIREDKVHMIDNVINTSLESGMFSLERSMANLINQGLITYDQASKATNKPEELRRLIKDVKFKKKK